MRPFFLFLFRHSSLCSKRRRKDNLQKGKALLQEGKTSDANSCFQKCVDVTPDMALALIKVSMNYILVNMVNQGKPLWVL